MGHGSFFLDWISLQNTEGLWLANVPYYSCPLTYKRRLSPFLNCKGYSVVFMPNSSPNVYGFDSHLNFYVSVFV